MKQLSVNEIKEQEVNRIYFYDYFPQQVNFFEEVIKGMNTTPRAIAPKFFYDERGSKLFDAICETEEYYPTKTEKIILENNADAIAKHIGDNCILIEPGSGSSQKIRILMDKVNPKAYLPMDISKDYLREVAQDVAFEYPWLEVHASCVDYTNPIQLPECFGMERKVAFFPGSSIGNFDPLHAIEFLRHLATMLQSGGGLLIGVDLKKDERTLNAAYNDNDGATAAFNQNLLTRMNDELAADFDIDKFRHSAFYNSKLGRIEMHLVSTENQTVSILDQEFEIKQEESIHTESSYKYTIDEFQTLVKQAGYNAVDVWTDKDALFSVHFFEVI